MTKNEMGKVSKVILVLKKRLLVKTEASKNRMRLGGRLLYKKGSSSPPQVLTVRMDQNSTAMSLKGLGAESKRNQCLSR